MIVSEPAEPHFLGKVYLDLNHRQPIFSRRGSPVDCRVRALTNAPGRAKSPPRAPHWTVVGTRCGPDMLGDAASRSRRLSLGFLASSTRTQRLTFPWVPTRGDRCNYGCTHLKRKLDPDPGLKILIHDIH